MARPKSSVQTVPLTVHIDGDLLRQLNLLLWDNVNGKVPYAAHKKFIEERIREYMNLKILSLESLGFPEGYWIEGPDEMVRVVRDRLINGEG